MVSRGGVQWSPSMAPSGPALAWPVARRITMRSGYTSLSSPESAILHRRPEQSSLEPQHRLECAWRKARGQQLSSSGASVESVDRLLQTSPRGLYGIVQTVVVCVQDEVVDYLPQCDVQHKEEGEQDENEAHQSSSIPRTRLACSGMRHRSHSCGMRRRGHGPAHTGAARRHRARASLGGVNTEDRRKPGHRKIRR